MKLMNQKELKLIKQKIEDYRRFIYVLLATGTFLYIGVLIGQGEKTFVQLMFMSGVDVVLLVVAFYFAYQAKKLKKKIKDELSS